MSRYKAYDDELHAHFITFSCYKRRRLLDYDRAKKVVLGVLNSELGKRQASCVGFVVMPDHVHAIVWFPKPKELGGFMKLWKGRSSSRIKKLFRADLPAYAEKTDPADAFWQRKYYSFNLYSGHKVRQKLDYIHGNPVAAGLVSSPCDWPWSSARYYELGKSVGVPIRWIF